MSPNGGGLANTTHPDGAAALDRRLGLAWSLDTEQIYYEPLGPGPGRPQPVPDQGARAVL